MARAQDKASLFLMVTMHFFSCFLDPDTDDQDCVFFTMTGPWAGQGYKHHIRLETAIGVEGFIAV